MSNGCEAPDRAAASIPGKRSAASFSLESAREGGGRGFVRGNARALRRAFANVAKRLRGTYANDSQETYTGIIAGAPPPAGPTPRARCCLLVQLQYSDRIGLEHKPGGILDRSALGLERLGVGGGLFKAVFVEDRAQQGAP